ncbi:unnamed protein product [Vitrella brassicaformis CCMP3155]|uniref:Reverse transcriptase domain-containing protein n=1 Tax=Vitrella brassicaformis (strain CCMP3155) TaxID=1169540 RepID=A0A0G4GGP3_VITBC|nr:unnamed protein product [Vitrella brassicaformis CCMP3155]|eukprot:CEM28798.1 unnamed protein product [Vitrella brassicaformis CCMP3155]
MSDPICIWKRRFELFDEGDWETLRDDALEWQRRAHPVDRPATATATTSPAKRARRLAAGSNPRRTLELHPANLLKALKTAARGSAQGPTGWRYEHLRAIHDATSHVPLTKLVDDIVQSNIPDHVRPILGSARLIGLEKTDDDGSLTGGVRPIAIGEVLRRWVTRAICFLHRERFGEALSPHQYAVGVSSGAEKCIAAIRTFLGSGAADEKRVVLSLDAKNAFSTISRQAILEGVNDLFPELTDFFLQWYGASSDLWFAHYDGTVRTIASTQGTQQGDSGGPVWYVCGLHAVLRRLQAALPDCLVCAFADNVYIGRTEGRVEEAFRAAKTEMGSVDQILVDHKCVMWGEHFRPGMQRPASVPAEVALGEEGILVLGVPLGTDAFIAKHFAAIQRKT